MPGNHSLFAVKTPTIVEEGLPYLHPKIELSHLHNGKLLTSDEIILVNEWFKKNPDKNRYKFTCTNGNQYAIVNFSPKDNPSPKLCAIYLGRKSRRGLGEGSFGKVRLMQELTTGNWYAAKTESNLVRHELSLLEREIIVLKKLDRFYGEIKRQDKDKIILGMNLIPGMTLSEYFTINKVSLDEFLQIGINIINSVLNLHKLGELHCDVKSTNLIIEPVTKNVCLIDFQSCRPIDNSSVDNMPLLSTIAAPELQPKLLYDHIKRIYTEKTDAYATGVTLASLFRYVQTSDSHIEKIVKSIFSKLTLPDPEKRASLHEALLLLEFCCYSRISDSEYTIDKDPSIKPYKSKFKVTNFFSKKVRADTDDNDKSGCLTRSWPSKT